jgi:hypothetical protein
MKVVVAVLECALVTLSILFVHAFLLCIVVVHFVVIVVVISAIGIGVWCCLFNIV